MDSAKPGICILILSYNGGADTTQAIRSLKGERALIESIIVSENHSTDSTAELLESCREELGFRLLRPRENLGFAGGFNLLFDEALKTSEAQYFLVLNNDTEAEPGFLEALLRESGPDRVVSPMILWQADRSSVIQCAGDFDRTMIKMNNRFAGLKRDEVPPGPHEVEQTDGCCFLIHRKWLEQGFRFNDRLFIYFEDVELFLRLKSAGVDFLYVPASVLLHKEYGASGGRSRPSAFRNYYFYRNRMFIAKLLHSWPGRLLVYRRLICLAMEKYRQDRELDPRAARAISTGIKDFFLNRMGRREIP